MTLEDIIAERDYWKQEALGVRQAGIEHTLGQRLGLTTAEAWLLATMYQLNGKILLFSRAEDEMPGHCDERAMNSVHVIASRLRKKIGPESFTTVRKRGYLITSVGQAKCDELIY